MENLKCQELKLNRSLLNWNQTLRKSQDVVPLNFLKLCPDFTYCQSYCHLSTHVRNTKSVLLEILFILYLYLWFVPDVWDCSWHKRTVTSYKCVAKQVVLQAKQLPSWGYLQLLCSFSKFLCHNDLSPLQMLLWLPCTLLHLIPLSVSKPPSWYPWYPCLPVGTCAISFPFSSPFLHSATFPCCQTSSWPCCWRARTARL